MDDNEPAVSKLIPAGGRLLVNGPVRVEVKTGSCEIWGHVLRPGRKPIEIAPAPGFPAVPISARKGAAAEVALSPLEKGYDVSTSLCADESMPTYVFLLCQYCKCSSQTAILTNNVILECPTHCRRHNCVRSVRCEVCFSWESFL